MFSTLLGVDIGVLLGVCLGVLQRPKLLEKSEIFRLSEILRRRSEIFISYLYKNALFHMNMSPSGLCTSFSKVTLFSLPEVFCGPQICQKCVCGRGSARTPLWEITTLPQTLSRIPSHSLLSTHNSIRKYFVGNLVTAAPPPQYPFAIRLWE